MTSATVALVRPFLVITAVVATALGTGCGPAPGSEARVPAGGVRVVPADRVKGTCQVDDDDDASDDASPPRTSVEYVKLRDWQPSSQVAEVEATIVPRGSDPPQYTVYPSLTLHRPIGDSSLRVSRRYRGY